LFAVSAKRERERREREERDRRERARVRVGERLRAGERELDRES
jgi:hypothetical protein